MYVCMLPKTIFLPMLLLTYCLLFSCGSAPEPEYNGLPPSSETDQPSTSPSSSLSLEQLQSLLEAGSPASLVRMAELLRGQDLPEQYRALGAAAASLMNYVYSDFEQNFPVMEASAGAPYQQIIRNAERGIYTAPSSASRNFLEYVLPFISFYVQEGSGRIDMDRLRSAITHLNRAAQLNNTSVLPHLFTGFAL